MASGLYIAGTTDKLQITTTSAAALDCVISSVDWLAGAGTPVSPQLTKFSSATTSDVLAAPAASTIREVKQITVFNADASLSCDVSLLLNRSATTYVLWKVTLNAGEMFEYTEATGFYKFGAAAKMVLQKYVTADFVTGSTSFADITGLTFPVISGRNYVFLFMCTAISALATTGVQFAIGGVAVTYLEIAGVNPLLAGNGTTTATTFLTGRASAVNTAVIAAQTGEVTNQLYWYSGGFSPSASGTMAIRCASEVAASNVTVRKGSWAWMAETNN